MPQNSQALAICHGAFGKMQLQSEVHGADETARRRDDSAVESLGRQLPRIRPHLQPADSADPAASPLISTAAFGSASLAETINVATSSARSGRTALTVSCWDVVRGDAISRDFFSLEGNAIAFASAGNANAGSADGEE
jgi:hypothetical protein